MIPSSGIVDEKPNKKSKYQKEYYQSMKIVSNEIKIIYGILCGASQHLHCFRGSGFPSPYTIYGLMVHEAYKKFPDTGFWVAHFK